MFCWVPQVHLEQIHQIFWQVVDRGPNFDHAGPYGSSSMVNIQEIVKHLGEGGGAWSQWLQCWQTSTEWWQSIQKWFALINFMTLTTFQEHIPSVIQVKVSLVRAMSDEMLVPVVYNKFKKYQRQLFWLLLWYPYSNLLSHLVWYPCSRSVSYVTIWYVQKYPIICYCSELSFIFQGYHYGFCFSVASESDSYCTWPAYSCTVR